MFFSNSLIRSNRLLSAVALAGLAFPASAQLSVDIFVQPQGSNFQYDISVTNSGSQDVSLITLTDAPLGDGLITDTLFAPAEFVASYEPAFGFVDLVEWTIPFQAGTTQDGFTFTSRFGPTTNFQSFQAITSDGFFITGSTNIVPEVTSATSCLLGMTLLGLRRR